MANGETDKERIERERASWQYRAIEATQGPRSMLGAILLAVLGKQRRTVPQFRGQATITSNGFVLCDYLDKSGQIRFGAFLCDVADLTRNFRGLADHLRLTDAERVEMFDALRNWIAKDYRAIRDGFDPGKPAVKPWQ